MKFIAHLLIFLSLVSSALASPKSQWPGGAQAAVVLTYDDALPSHLDAVIPQLDKAGLKATFFLTGRFIKATDVERWKQAARSGHELGNHSINHPCARDVFPMPPQYFNQSYSIEVMLNEIKAMNAFLVALDKAPQHVYATPCGQHLVANGSYLPNLVASDIAPFIRSAQIAPENPAPLDPRKIDRSNIPCLFFPDSTKAADLIAYIDRVRQARGLAVLGFHAVGGSVNSISAEAHERLLNYLSRFRNEIWVAPLTDVMTYVFELRTRQ